MLGLDVDGWTGEITCSPHLPEWLTHIRVRGLRYGRTQADIDVRREGVGGYRILITRADGVLSEYAASEP